MVTLYVPGVLQQHSVPVEVVVHGQHIGRVVKMANLVIDKQAYVILHDLIFSQGQVVELPGLYNCLCKLLVLFLKEKPELHKFEI